MSSFTCPVDGALLVPVDRQGIEVDHCPKCRGVWLDRGELDKIIERSLPPPAAASPRGDDRNRGYGDHHRPRRKRSFLEDLFD